MRSSYFLILLALLTASGCKGRKSDNSAVLQNGNAEIVFSRYEHDFGKVKEGQKIAHLFTFKNQGTGDLVLQSVTTTCGCTVPKYSVKPIAPGEESSLEVIFDTSGRNGMQTKTITVKSNASKPVILLKITADVE